MSVSSLSIAPQHPHAFTNPLAFQKPTQTFKDSLKADTLSIQKNTPQFSLQTEIFAKHGLKVEPGSILNYLQNPASYPNLLSLYRFPQSLGEALDRYKAVPMATAHEQNFIKAADTLIPIAKATIQNSSEADKGKLVRKIGNIDLSKDPATFFDGSPSKPKKPLATGALSNEELGAAVRNLIAMPKALKKMATSLMGSLLPFLAQNDPKGYQQIMDMTKKSKLWTLKDSNGDLMATVSHGHVKSMLQGYAPEKTAEHAAYLNGHAMGGILLHSSMDAKPDVSKALIDNLVDQSRKDGQKHLWVYLPDTEALKHQVQAKHGGVAVSVEDAQKVLPFLKPEIVQSTLSAYNMAKSKL